MSLWVAAVLTAYMFAVFWKSRREFSQLTMLEPGGSTGASVLIVIPARNEARNLPDCLDSLARDPAEPVEQEILVVDDASTDGTARIAAGHGARAMTAPALPKGLIGKSNACYEGSQYGSSAKWLLFLDADTRFEPGFVQAIVSHAEDFKLDVVSAVLESRCRVLWEHALAPYWLAIQFAGVNLEAVHSIKLQQLLIFGQCILFRKDAYEFTGGHRTALRRATDDLGLASVVKRHRLRYEIVRAESLGQYRPGPTLAGLWRMHQRTAFDFLSENTPGLRWQAIAAIVLTSCWAPMLWWLWQDEERIAMCIFAAVPTLATLAWYRNPLRAILAPAAIYLFAGVALHSLVTHLFGMSAVWKGRKV